MKKILVTLGFLAFPLVTFAASVQNFLVGFVWFTNNVIVPLIFAIAVLFFIWNAFLFFILGGTNDEGRDKAKKLMLYGLMAMVLIISIWGVIKLGTRALGIDRSDFICPDYVPYCNSGNSNRSGNIFEPGGSYYGDDF